MEDGIENSAVLGENEGRRLEVIQWALIARAHELETLKRLPRGYSVGEVLRERNILVNEIARLGSLRAQLIRGVDVAARVPVTNGAASGDTVPALDLTGGQA